jgi:hypothetical protein
MKKLALWLSYLGTVVSVIFFLGALESIHAAQFFCSSGNVTCLIAAINQANKHAGADTINLDPGTYTLTSVDNSTLGTANGLPIITSRITINGEDAATTIIERGLPGAPRFRIFQVAVSGKLTLNGLTIRNGSSNAGGILNAGNLSINSSIIESNDAGPGDAGGIFNQTTGTLNLTNSIVIRNHAETAGGIFNSGIATITHSSIIDNDAAGGGGIENTGIENIVTATMTIQNSTISLNTADFGGGISNGGTMTITNSTIANNGAVATGAGINNGGGTLKITNSTIAGNTPLGGQNIASGGGIAAGGIVELQNTILALNTKGMFGHGPDCDGTITSLGNNIIGDLSDCNINLLPSDIIGDPGLGDFTDNGKPGNGHFPLLPTSQAIDAGNDDVCPKRDQLGRRRIGPCDIGAIRFLDGVDRKHKDQDDRRNQEDVAEAFR